MVNAHLFIGLVGSGKSTYCCTLCQDCETVGPSIHIVNLDPAMDIRELICLDYVMEELGLGPNGALDCGMEELEDDLNAWLAEQLDNYMDNDYLIVDCRVLRNFVEHLKSKNFNICAVYLLDSWFIIDVAKFISGCVASLSASYLNPQSEVLLELIQRMAPQFVKLNKAF